MYIETDTGIMVKLKNVKSTVMYDDSIGIISLQEMRENL